MEIFDDGEGGTIITGSGRKPDPVGWLDPPYLSDGVVSFEFDPVLRRQDAERPIGEVPSFATEVRSRPAGFATTTRTRQVDWTERRKVLLEAAALIDGDRDAHYGPPAENFERIAAMWRVLFPERDWSPADVARAMAALKLARTPQGYKRDSAVDLAGYAALYAELEEL